MKLGDDQFAQATDWDAAGRLALVGMGVEPGLSDVFARFAADHLFSDIDELGVRDGANLVVTDDEGNEIFAPSFSIWTTIEECLNPPVIWEEDAGWYTTPPFSEPEVFEFPEGIGPVECVNVEHEEVLLMPRWVDAKRVTFKYGLGAEFINVLQVLHLLGLDSTSPVRVRSENGPVHVAPRDVVAASLPDPATIGPRMTGKTCAGLWVTGTGTDGEPREVYLYHVADNEWTMREYESQCVVWQTALNPVIALELLGDRGVGGPRRARPRGVRCRAVPRAHGAARQPTAATASPGASRTGPRDRRAAARRRRRSFARRMAAADVADARAGVTTRRPWAMNSMPCSLGSRRRGARAAAPTARWCRRSTTRATPCSSRCRRCRADDAAGARDPRARRHARLPRLARRRCTCTRT